ncbi:hypothetical protein NDU88_005692 [Pleurodeles waltl]|uniref:Uncharacterized protein n=1 Tax=Pleurodeles waltl TaxID=8319 RepID=A0AAV7TDD9_PLEWA|nr:hypothetical protein NDU88_005692 [Pleurodeles waltl]
MIFFHICYVHCHALPSSRGLTFGFERAGMSTHEDQVGWEVQCINMNELACVEEEPDCTASRPEEACQTVQNINLNRHM